MTASSETVVVEGSDALTYLDSQCTQDLSSLEVGARAETFVLSPSGGLVTVATIARTDERHLVLYVSHGTVAATTARLERFAIRADVRFLAAEATSWSADEELVRIDAAIPGVAELAHELVPHALDAALLERCVSFTKGCYPGQELVARMESRHATPPYVLRRVTSDTELGVHDGVGDPQRTGEVTSVVLAGGSGRWHGLCVLHRRDAEVAEVEVRTARGSVLARLS